MLGRSTSRYLLIVMAAAILLRLLALAIPIDPRRAPDSLSFVLITESLLDDGRMAYEDPGAPSVTLRAFRSLTYPVYLAAFRKLHMGLWGALLVQALLGVIVVGCVYRIGVYTLGGEFGLLAAGIGALYWSSIFFERQILTESLYTPLLIIGVTLALHVFRKPAVGRKAWVLTIAAGLTLGLASITRPVGVVAVAAIAGVALLFIAFEARTPDTDDASSARARLLQIAAFVLGAALVVGGAVARNQVVLGKPVLMTSGGMNFWMGNEVGTIHDAWRIMGEEASTRGEVGMDRWFWSDTRAHLGEIIAGAPALLARKCWGYFAPAAREIEAWPHRLIFPFIFFGVLLARPPRWRPWLVVLAIASAHVAFGLLFVADARYRTPTDPFSWLLASAGMILLWRRGVPGRTVVVALVALNLLARGFQ